MKFDISYHCKERYKQRIGVALGENLYGKILTELKAAKDITDKVINECPRYVQHLKTKYKSAGQRILVFDNKTLFICKKRPGTGLPNKHLSGLFDVLTCYQFDEKYLQDYRNSVQSRKDTFIILSTMKKV